MDDTTKLLAVYTVIEKQDGKEIWLRVGSGFHNRDGSLSLLLDAVPINGRLQVREYRPRDLSSLARPRRRFDAAPALPEVEAGSSTRERKVEANA